MSSLLISASTNQSKGTLYVAVQLIIVNRFRIGVRILLVVIFLRVAVYGLQFLKVGFSVLQTTVALCRSYLCYHIAKPFILLKLPGKVAS